MITYTCDRCHQKVENYKDLFKILIVPILGPFSNPPEDKKLPLDLCETCCNQLKKEFSEPFAKEA